MAKSIALLFAGQGAQQVGMGKDLSQQFAVAANRFAVADTELGYSISQIAFDGPIDELTKTSRCQVALYVHGIAVLDVLREQLGPFNFVATAGLSLGEFTAHAAAGTFDFLTGLRLVAHRGQYMEEACHSTSGTMAAFIGRDEETLQKIARASGCGCGQCEFSRSDCSVRESGEYSQGDRARKTIWDQAGAPLERCRSVPFASDDFGRGKVEI